MYIYIFPSLKEFSELLLLLYIFYTFSQVKKMNIVLFIAIVAWNTCYVFIVVRGGVWGL